MKLKHCLFFFFMFISISVYGKEPFSPFVLDSKTNLTEKVIISRQNTSLMDKKGKEIGKVSPRQFFYVLKPEEGVRPKGDCICIGNSVGEEVGWVDRGSTISIPCFLVILPNSEKGLSLFNSSDLKGESVRLSPKDCEARLNFVLPNQEGPANHFAEILSVPLEDSASEPEKSTPVSDGPRKEIVFVVDTTPYSELHIEVLQEITSLLEQALKDNKWSEENMGFGLVEYRDKSLGLEFDSRVLCKVNAPFSIFQKHVQNLKCDSNRKIPFNVELFSGLKSAADDAGWSEGSQKTIVVIGSSPSKDVVPLWKGPKEKSACTIKTCAEMGEYLKRSAQIDTLHFIHNKFSAVDYRPMPDDRTPYLKNGLKELQELQELVSKDGHAEILDQTNQKVVSEQMTNFILLNSKFAAAPKERKTKANSSLQVLHGYISLEDTRTELFSWGIFICRSDFEAYKQAFVSEYASLNEYAAGGNGNLRRIVFNFQDIFSSMIDGTPISHPKKCDLDEIACPLISFFFKDLPSLKRNAPDYSDHLKNVMSTIKSWTLQMFQAREEDIKWNHLPDGKEYTIFSLKKSEKKR